MVAKPGAWNFTVRAVQRAPVAISGRAMVTKGERGFQVMLGMGVSGVSMSTLLRWLIGQEVSWRLSASKSSHMEAGGI